ncbi:hypothetical protein [Sphingomonas sp. Y38-1Y]|uniref:hypothetical protein n=1 Tax=Sphingomonas sp. Y38-1Y TaxID=3078265 RepID=UPI0028E25300|nr:hypothetical protein [Sphingomonas sp. Y38-1Y]
MEHPRTASARDHDDSAIIDAAEDAPGTVGRAGGNLARDVGTRDELANIGDPEGREGVEKRDSIDHDQSDGNR